MIALMHVCRRRLVVCAGVLVCALSVHVGAQSRPKVTALASAPTSAIFIGNSFFYFNNGLNAMVRGLLQAAQPDAQLRTRLVTISGSGLDWHDVESYFRPNALERYVFDANNNVVFLKPSDRLFDVALMMDCSSCPIHPDLKGAFVDAAKKSAETARRHGATPVFFMSWAYADKPEMTEGLAAAYIAAGNANEAMVIPAGLAFARVVQDRPDINLYVADKRHPTLAGSYLAACATYAMFYGKSPVGLSYTAGLNAEVARYLQSAAWQTVEAFVRR